MGLFNSGNDEQKQRKKQAEKILDTLVGGLMPTRTRMAFFGRMASKGIKARHQEKVRSKVLKTIKNEVENYELEPTTEAINQRIEEILNENSDVEVLQKRKNDEIAMKTNIEEKFGVDLTNRVWFKCSIEEEKYSTFTNQRQRNFDTAYVIINEDNFEIYKESVWLKSNMGSRKIYFYNITSIDYDASGKLHASSSTIINTKSAEHIQLKFVTKDKFDLMNNAFESYIEKTHNAQQTPNQNIPPISAADELLKYAELYEKGLLTQDEFEIKKAELLGNSITDSDETLTQDENYSLAEEFAQENGIIIEDKPKFCPNCGTPFDDGSKFCTNCGNKL